MIVENLFAIASFTPNSLQFPNSWLGHLPFAAWIIQEVSPKIFVELGTHTGNSYFSFCQAVLDGSLSTKCYAVDTWQGDEHAGQYGDEVFSKVNAYHQENYSGFSRLLRMTFDDAASYFSDSSIDLLHIDGLHTYDAVRHDFETWLPKLARGAIVMFHDTNVRERNFGVWKLWRELQSQYSNHLEFYHSNGLGVLQLNNDSNVKKIEWLQPDSSEKMRLVKYFTSLGGRQEERFDKLELNNHVSSLNKVIIERDRQLADLNQELSKATEQIVVLNKVIADRDNQILAFNQELSTVTEQIVVLNKVILDRDQQISTLNQVVVEQREKILKFNQSLSQQHEHIQFLLRNKSEQKREIHLTYCAITQNTIMNLGRTLNRFSYRKTNEYMRLKREIKKQPLFDFNWYATNNPELKKSNAALLHHYYYFGIEEGRDPSPYFHSQWYMDEYPDVARSGMNPLLHYIMHGVEEERNPNPYFDIGWYLKEYPEVVNTGMNPLLHYIKHGKKEGRNPNPYFDTSWYLSEDTTGSVSDMDPLLHYLKYGLKDGRDPNPFFDTHWYMLEYPDVIISGMNPLLHYLRYGIEQGRNTNSIFDTRWYLSEYPDVANSGTNPLLHYIKKGVIEGKNPAPCFNTRWYLTEYPDVADCGMHPLHHYLKFGAKEGRKTLPGT